MNRKQRSRGTPDALSVDFLQEGLLDWEKQTTNPSDRDREDFNKLQKKYDRVIEHIENLGPNVDIETYKVGHAHGWIEGYLASILSRIRNRDDSIKQARLRLAKKVRSGVSGRVSKAKIYRTVAEIRHEEPDAVKKSIDEDFSKWIEKQKSNGEK